MPCVHRERLADLDVLQDRTSEVELRILDAQALIPVGASADIEIVIDSRESALAVPSRAITGRGNVARDMSPAVTGLAAT